jgi:hypothetical protein
MLAGCPNHRRLRTTRPLSDRWSEEDARRILAEWGSSGTGLYPFARARGITPQRLAWWRDQLTKKSAAELSLVPATVTEGAFHLGASGRVVVRVAGDVIVELSDVSPAWVARLIRELARPA